MEKRDKLDWIRIALMIAYMGIVTTIFIIGIFEAGILLFFILVLAWTIPFIFLMALGEWIKTRNLPFYISIIGFAVIAGLFFGYSKFFLEDDILMGIFTVALFGIMVSYIVLRFIDTDDRQQSSMLLVPVLAIIGGAILIASNLIAPIITTPFISLPLMVTGGICIALSFVFAFYTVLNPNKLTDGTKCATTFELECQDSQGKVKPIYREITKSWDDPQTPARCDKPLEPVKNAVIREAEAQDPRFQPCKIKKIRK